MTGLLAAGTAGSAAAGTVAPVAASSGARYPITGIRGWPDAGDLMLQGTPPASAIVRIHLPIDGQPAWTFAWFGYTTGHRDEGLQLCLESLDGATEAQGTINSSCGIASLPAGKAVAVVNELGADAGSEIGVASSEITSVIARPPGGGSGLVTSGRGFPYRLWLVGYPEPDNNPTFEFRNTAGHQVTQLNFTSDNTGPSQPTSGGIMVLRDPAGGLTAYLADGYVEFFGPGEADDQVAWADSTIWESQLSVTFGTAPQSDSMVYAYGYAPADVARLVVHMADGEMVSGPTIAGWRGSGIRLWGVGGLPKVAT